MPLACTKDFQLHIEPDPTFQGMLWNKVGGVNVAPATSSFVGVKNNFTLTTNAVGLGGTSTYNESGGDGASGPLIIPAVAQARNCILHVEVTVANPNIVSASIDMYVDAVHTGILGLSAIGVVDTPFVLSAGVGHTYRFQMDIHVNENGGNFGALTWTGYLYVASYS